MTTTNTKGIGYAAMTWATQEQLMGRYDPSEDVMQLICQRDALRARCERLEAALRELVAVTPDVPRANAASFHLRIADAKDAARAALAGEGK